MIGGLGCEAHLHKAYHISISYIIQTVYTLALQQKITSESSFRDLCESKGDMQETHVSCLTVCILEAVPRTEIRGVEISQSPPTISLCLEGRIPKHVTDTSLEFQLQCPDQNLRNTLRRTSKIYLKEIK
jgi:hypothetical protein